MGKHATDLLQRRVKLGGKLDAIFTQLAEVHEQLQKVHGEISGAIKQKEQKGLNANLPNIISNFPRIMAKRLEMAIEGRLSPSEQSLEAAFTRENISIVSRLEASIRPMETTIEYYARLGIRMEEGRC